MRTGPRRGVVAALALTVVTVASLGIVGWQRVTAAPAVTGDTATVSGLTTDLHTAAWVEMNHLEGGFDMPDSMMPGAPTGDQVRLGISLTLSNTSGDTQAFNLPEEFQLGGGRHQEPQPLRADTIGTLPRLAPGAAVDGTLYFDIEVPEEDDPPLYLQWTRGGDTIALTVPLTDEEPDHQH